MPKGTSRRAVLLGAAAMITSACSSAAVSKAKALPVDTRPAAKPVADGGLVLLGPPGAIDPAVIDAFAKAHGITVTQPAFGSMAAMAAQVTAGGAYDVVLPTAKWTQTLWQTGKLRRIDRNSLLNGGGVFDAYTYFDNPWYDAGSQYSVPFRVYKTGIGWRKDKVGHMAGLWSDAWNSAASGHAYVLDDRDEGLGLAALRLGLDLNTGVAADLTSMVALLTDLKKHLRGFSSAATANLRSGDALLTQAHSGDIGAALTKGDVGRYGFETTREGTPVNSDCFAIPSSAAHPGTALLFIDFVLRPDNVVRNVNYAGYQMPARAAQAPFEKLTKTVPACVVTVDDLAKEVVFRNGTPAVERARDAAWAAVRNA
jgi:spermidine/putrescine transport system substrate-binding protein